MIFCIELYINRLESFGNHLVRVHDAVGIEQVLQVAVDLQDLGRFLEVEVGRLMEAHSVLCADAALVSCHLFEYEVVVEF